MHYETGGGPLAMAGVNGAPFYNYGDMYAPWEYLNPSSYSFSPLSDYSTDESDLLLMTSSESDEFLQQINGGGGCSPITMHPNLVHTLKNMVLPAPSACSGTTMYTAQPSVLDRLEQLNRMENERLRQPSVVVPKLEFPDLAPPVGVVLPPAEKPHKVVVEKSETEESIEAAVVSVDLIKNRRPFRCQHDGCNKTFKNPQTMKMHHKTHYSDGSAGTNGCTLPTLTSSLKAGHNKKTPSRCPKCKKTFVGLYELRRHYGRKHSEGEKPFGCSKCGKKFYIEVDVRDHEKLCGKPIECKCGLKFAFKCNLVAHKKAHPACQDHHPIPATTPTGTSSFSDDSDQQSRVSSSGTTWGVRTTAACKRIREESSSPPILSSLHIPSAPDFKCIPEAPQFKLARRDFSSGGISFPPETNPMWSSNMVYPDITFANLQQFGHNNFHCNQQQFIKPLQPPFEALNYEMGMAFNHQLPYKA